MLLAGEADGSGEVLKESEDNVLENGRKGDPYYIVKIQQHCHLK